MAITKTTTIYRIIIDKAIDATAASNTNDGNTSIQVLSQITLDDTSDAELPVTTIKKHNIYRYVEDGGSATNISAEDSLVQSIAGAIWT
tara:strand:+ start:653 stop:919 length:267 start_codon:yes stop_codon:yes gene_type:complete